MLASNNLTKGGTFKNLSIRKHRSDHERDSEFINN